MPHTIRPFAFTDSDYRAAVALRNQIYPDIQSTVEVWKHNAKTRRQDPSYHFFIAEDEIGKIQAFAQCARANPTSHIVSLGLVGQPQTWSNGIAQDLLTTVKTIAAEYNAEALVQKVQESDQGKLAFLHDQGFVAIMRYPLSVLNVTDFDPTPFSGKLDRIKANGIHIAPMTKNWQHEASQQKFLYDLDWQLRCDVPHFEARKKKSFEKFLADEIFHPNALPNSYFIAWEKETAVGMTCFVKRGKDTHIIATALTGVLDSHRRRGIATALKVTSIQFAQSAGYRTILTHNEENNPMHQLNQQLGFKTRPAWLDLQLRLPNSIRSS